MAFETPVRISRLVMQEQEGRQKGERELVEVHSPLPTVEWMKNMESEMTNTMKALTK